MGRYFTKRMMFLLLTPIMSLPLLISSSSSSSEGKLPKLADLEFEDPNLCKVFHGKTCCSASRMLSATYGEAFKDCLDLFDGNQSVTLSVCASFCDRVFEACSDSSDAANEVIVPCGSSESIICGKASKWEPNVTAFCYAVGFTVQAADDDSGETPVVEEPLAKCENCGCAWLWLQVLQIIRLAAMLRLGTLLSEKCCLSLTVGFPCNPVDV